jgi:carbamoyltransferase
MSLFEPINRQKINVDLYPILKKTDDIIGNQSLIDFSFHVQKSLERVGLSVIKNMLDITGAKNLILTGGAALNVVANTVFKKNIPRDVNLYIEPMCGDEGNCIGAAQLYYHSISQSIKKTQFKNLYLGPKPNYQFNLTDGEIEYDNISKKDIVDLLVNQHIVAIFQGGAEAGPRALGNRSLLFDPRVKNGKEIVNSIKRREKFRPFACTVLLEHVQNWFNLEGLQESPYMMYALQALDGIKEKIPSVIHVDGTSRVQTITKDQNLHFYELIEKFYLDTGVPLLFNTSFNLGGEPLVETVQNAIDTLRNSKLEYLYLPEINKLVYIKNR